LAAPFILVQAADSVSLALRRAQNAARWLLEPGLGKGASTPYWNGFRTQEFWRFRQAVAMKDQWNETLRCPVCDKTGRASLSQDNGDTPTIQLVPDGFKVVSTRHGPDFYCGVCDVAVKP